jgi:hypothetical protein
VVPEDSATFKKKEQPLDLVLSHLVTVKILRGYFFKIYFNVGVIDLFMFRPLSDLFHLGFSTSILGSFLHLRYLLYPSRSS